MFYCDPCADRLNWLQVAFRSWGTCEICQTGPRPCNDYPSSKLPSVTVAQVQEVLWERDDRQAEQGRG